MSTQVTVASRLARVRSQFTSPADVWLAVRMFGWALVLPVMKHLVPVKSLARLVHLPPRSPALQSASPDRHSVRSTSSVDRILVFARWAARVIRWRSGGNCLERGLIAFRYLGAAGANPTLVVGLGPDDRGGMVGHAWVLLDGTVAGERESAVSIYTPVFAFAADGTLIDAPSAASPQGRAV